MTRIHCITYRRLGYILAMRKRGYRVPWSPSLLANSDVALVAD